MVFRSREYQVKDSRMDVLYSDTGSRVFLIPTIKWQMSPTTWFMMHYTKPRTSSSTYLLSLQWWKSAAQDVRNVGDDHIFLDFGPPRVIP